MKHLFLLTLLAVAAVAQDEIAWIKENAVPLKSVTAGSGFEDLQPLKKTIGKARIVSLGEATHGTREFFQLKHRMLEFLATEMGFTIFSIEASMPEAYRLNDYVLTGKGDPRALLKGMYFWTWDTEEVLEMIEWMRKFNASGKGRVEFTGFDMQTATVAGRIVADFAKKYDADQVAPVESLTRRAQAAPYTAMAGERYVPITASIDAAGLQGKKMRFRGYIKTENVTGAVQLWWRADAAPGNVLSFRNLQDKGVTGTNDWQMREIEMEVPAGAKSIHFGGTFSGGGTAWFDSFTVEADGEPIPTPEADLAFEGDEPKGFYIFQTAYRAAIDREVFQAGARSLRLRRVTPLPAPENDPAKVLAEWNGVLKQLDASLAKYGEAGASAQEVAWMRQNARIIQQGLQAKTGEVSRDASMARNVEWILEQNPQAKIVLWAHNGHVMKPPAKGFQPMGTELAKKFGDQMVVMGFAFHQGGFQAIESGKGLRNFTVAPAPEGSLDAMLASAGHRAMAIDLRQAPEGLRRELRTRSIGAIYSESAASQYLARVNAPANYDALLFVENTTPARKNIPPALLVKQADGSRRDPETGLSLRLPEGWTTQGEHRLANRETTIVLRHAIVERGYAGLYYAVGSTEPLEKSIENKTAQRLRERFEGYAVRPDSMKEHQVDGKPARSWVADYKEKGVAMVEQFTRVQTPGMVALFFTRSPAAEEAPVREALTPMVESLRLP